MDDSFCGPNLIKILKDFTSKLKYSSFLRLYKASIDGYKAENFHGKCDEKKKIIILIKANDFVFGGYTSNCFDSGYSGSEKKSKEAFLFSLSNPENRPLVLNCVNLNKSISDDQLMGPCFGESDILISNKCNKNEYSYCLIEKTYQGINISFFFIFNKFS
jgi:hypothetical protein